jgi:hypothetical protein
MKTLEEMIRDLPPDAQRKVEDFVKELAKSAPHVGFASAMLWMSVRTSERVRGLPGCFGWDNFHQ